jgi:hypothetical protein
MPYAFTEYPDEPEPQSSPSRGGRPPSKVTGADLLDPPSDAPSAYKRPYVSFWVGVLLLLASLAALLAVGLLSR